MGPVPAVVVATPVVDAVVDTVVVDAAVQICLACDKPARWDKKRSRLHEYCGRTCAEGDGALPPLPVLSKRETELRLAEGGVCETEGCDRPVGRKESGEGYYDRCRRSCGNYDTQPRGSGVGFSPVGAPSDSSAIEYGSASGARRPCNLCHADFVITDAPGEQPRLRCEDCVNNIMFPLKKMDTTDGPAVSATDSWRSGSSASVKTNGMEISSVYQEREPHKGSIGGANRGSLRTGRSEGTMVPRPETVDWATRDQGGTFDDILAQWVEESGGRAVGHSLDDFTPSESDWLRVQDYLPGKLWPNGHGKTPGCVRLVRLTLAVNRIQSYMDRRRAKIRARHQTALHQVDFFKCGMQTVERTRLQRLLAAWHVVAHGLKQLSNCSKAVLTTSLKRRALREAFSSWHRRFRLRDAVVKAFRLGALKMTLKSTRLDSNDSQVELRSLAQPLGFIQPGNKQAQTAWSNDEGATSRIPLPFQARQSPHLRPCEPSLDRVWCRDGDDTGTVRRRTSMGSGRRHFLAWLGQTVHSRTDQSQRQDSLKGSKGATYNYQMDVSTRTMVANAAYGESGLAEWNQEQGMADGHYASRPHHHGDWAGLPVDRLGPNAPRRPRASDLVAEEPWCYPTDPEDPENTRAKDDVPAYPVNGPAASWGSSQGSGRWLRKLDPSATGLSPRLQRKGVSVYRDAATLKLWHLQDNEVTTDIYDVKLVDFNYSLLALQHQVFRHDLYRLPLDDPLRRDVKFNHIFDLHLSSTGRSGFFKLSMSTSTDASNAGRRLIHWTAPDGSPLGPHPHSGLLKKWKQHSAGGTPTPADKQWLLSEDQPSSWHRDAIIYYNRALDVGCADSIILNHDLGKGSTEPLRLLEARRGITWRSFLLSERCSMFSPSKDKEATILNAAFPIADSEALREKCDPADQAEHAMVTEAEVEAFDRSCEADVNTPDATYDRTTGKFQSVRPATWSGWRRLLHRFKCRFTYVLFTMDALRRVQLRDPSRARRLLNVAPFVPPDTDLKGEELLDADRADFEDVLHRHWHHRSVASQKHDVARAMLSVYIPTDAASQFMSDLASSLDDATRKEVTERHVSHTLQEMGAVSGDPASIATSLDRSFKEYIGRSLCMVEGRANASIALANKASESDDDDDSVSSTQSTHEAQLMRILVEGRRMLPARACNQLPPGTYALAEATLQHILNNSDLDQSEMRRVMASQDSFSLDDENNQIIDLYACDETQLQVYRNNTHDIEHAIGPFSWKRRQAFVKEPLVQMRGGCTTHCSVCFKVGVPFDVDPMCGDDDDPQAWKSTKFPPREGPLVCCSGCMYTVHSGCVGDQGTSRNRSHEPHAVRCGHCESHKTAGIAYDYGMKKAAMWAASDQVRSTSGEPAKSKAPASDRSRQPGKSEKPDPAPGASQTDQAPAVMEQNSTYNTVVISTVSKCPPKYQLLSTVRQLDRGDTDGELNDAEVIAASTPILCKFSSDYTTAQWEAGEFGRLAPDLERPRVVRELTNSGHYTEEFTSQSDLNTCLKHVGYVSASPGNVGPHPGKQGHRLSIWTVDHRLRMSLPLTLVDPVQPVDQWPLQGDKSKVGPHWRMTPFTTLPSGNQPPGAAAHILLLQDEGVDVDMLAKWFTSRATEEVEKTEDVAPATTDPEFLDGWDDNSDDEDGDVEAEDGNGVEAKDVAAGAVPAGTNVVPQINELEELQRPRHVSEAVWGILSTLATRFCLKDAHDDPGTRSEAELKTTASHLVIKLLAKYNHDDGSSALLAVSTQNDLWASLPKTKTAPALGSASPILPAGQPLSSPDIPRVFSNAATPSPAEPAPVSETPARVVAFAEAEVTIAESPLKAALRRTDSTIPECFPLSVQLSESEAEAVATGKFEGLGDVSPYNVDDSERRADELPHSGTRDLLLFIVPTATGDGTFQYQSGKGLFCTDRLERPRLLVAIYKTGRRQTITYYHVDKGCTWQWDAGYSFKLGTPYVHNDDTTLTLPAFSTGAGASAGGDSRGSVSGLATSTPDPDKAPSAKMFYNGMEFNVNTLGTTELKNGGLKTLQQMGSGDLDTTTRDATGQHIQGQSTCKDALQHLVESGFASIDKDTRDLHKSHSTAAGITNTYITPASDGNRKLPKCLKSYCFQKWFVEDFYPAVRSLPLALYGAGLYTVIVRDCLPLEWVKAWNVEVKDHNKHDSSSVVAEYAAPGLLAKMQALDTRRILPFGHGNLLLAELCYYMLDKHTSKNPKLKSRVAAVRKMHLFKRFGWQNIAETANEYTLRLQKVRTHEARDNHLISLNDLLFKAVWCEGLCNPTHDALISKVGDPEWDNVDIDTMIEMAIKLDRKYTIDKTKVLCDGSKWNAQNPPPAADDGGAGTSTRRPRRDRRPKTENPAVQEIESDTDAPKVTLSTFQKPAVFKATKVYRNISCLPCNKITCSDLVCNVPECVARHNGKPTRYHNKAGCFIFCVQQGGILDLPEVNNLKQGVHFVIKAYKDQLSASPFGKDNPMNDKAKRDEVQKKNNIDFEHVRSNRQWEAPKPKQLGATSSTTTIEEVDTSDEEEDGE